MSMLPPGGLSLPPRPGLLRTPGLATSALFARFAEGEIAGGSVYDALVAAAAVEHGFASATLDRRAQDV